MYLNVGKLPNQKQKENLPDEYCDGPYASRTVRLEVLKQAV